MSEDTTWTRLFDRAAEHEVPVAAVREAVAARREARAEGEEE